MNDPLEIATTCIDWVNPQGRKNVAKPIISGVRVLCSIFLKKLKIPPGRAMRFLENTPVKFKPSVIITSEAMIPNIAAKVKLMPIALPIIPSNPPKSAKLTSRPV